MNAIGRLLRNNKDSLWQFIRFGIVGGLGVLVNMGVLIACRKLFPLLWASAGVPEGEGVWFAIPGTEYNIRWYHVMSTVAFLLANLFNFQLNRWWTFKSHKLAGWFREYWPFLIVGLVALAVGQVIITALMHPGLRSRQYWANLISIICTIPVNFLVNKFWTFRAARQPSGKQGGQSACTSNS